MTTRPGSGSPPPTSSASELVALARLAPRQLVLTAGPGAGDLAIAAKRAQPCASVIVMESDLAALTHTRSRARALGMVIRFDLARLEELPYGERTFDRVLLLAPASPRGIQADLRHMLPVLRVGGELHLFVPQEVAREVPTAPDRGEIRQTTPHLRTLAHLCVERR